MKIHVDEVNEKLWLPIIFIWNYTINISNIDIYGYAIKRRVFPVLVEFDGKIQENII